MERAATASAETTIRNELEIVTASLERGYFFWKSHIDMEQGNEKLVNAEINEQANPFFLKGSEAPTAAAAVQTSASMAAELRGDKDEFEISPGGEVARDLIAGRALWTWSVKPLTFGHGKKLHLLLYLKPRMAQKESSPYPLPVKEADIDVAISPYYVYRTHRSLLFGAGGGSGLLGVFMNKKVRDSLRRVLKWRASVPEPVPSVPARGRSGRHRRRKTSSPA